MARGRQPLFMNMNIDDYREKPTSYIINISIRAEKVNM